MHSVFGLDAIMSFGIVRPSHKGNDRVGTDSRSGGRSIVRKFFWTTGLLLALTGLSRAQTTNFLRPVNPRDIKFTPIDTNSAIISPSLPASSNRFS